MKSLIVLLLSLMSISVFASETKYNCSAKYLAKYRPNGEDKDTKDAVENIQVTIDRGSSRAVFPISKKRISIEIFEINPPEDGFPGQYSLNAILSKDKDSDSEKETYDANTYFMGLDQEIGLLLQVPTPGAKKSAFAVLCKLEQTENSTD